MGDPERHVLVGPRGDRAQRLGHVHVDRLAELVESAELLPEAGFIAEEGTGSRNLKGYNWIVDPLDGTREFIKGIPEFCISIGLCQNEKPVAGGIYNPATGETLNESVK